MINLERFDVLWDFAHERYDRDYWPQGKCIDAGLGLGRISVLESALAAIIEANDRGWGEEFIRAIDDAKSLLEPPQ